MVWTSSPNPAYKPGPFMWDYASDEDRERCQNAISRTVALREPQEFDASTHVDEHYHCWVWPLHSPELAACMLAVQVPSELKRLSARERTALELLAGGSTTREIAERMGVSVSTVHTHFRRARKKLKLRTVEALIGFSARHCYPTTAPITADALAKIAELRRAAKRGAHR
jgi:DNA-binding CsgD family transcriptional regulator